MTRIKVLDEKLANQIAAGEVVERPSSVVKELVENAIDAGSTTIDVFVEEGGLSLIRVVDNGGGIDPEDLSTAFQRHATSKISSGSDLFRIASLGFRGEALPSIAAVSRLTSTSANSDSGLARKLVIEGGTMVSEEPANAPQGTEMSVRDLFYNTPARLKYMKSIQTELGHISDYMNRVALAHPGIAVTLRHNGSVLLQTLGTGDRLQVIAAVYGSSTAKAMLPVSASDPDFELTGYVSKPELTRANRNGITLVVNGRYIRSFGVNSALLQAYHTLLPINRYPLAVLEVDMHPSLLDVNVHPSKMEVRFSKETELKALIEKSVKAALGTQRYIPGPDAGRKQPRSGPVYTQESIAFHIGDRLGQDQEPAGNGSGDNPSGAGALGADSSKLSAGTANTGAAGFFPVAGRNDSRPDRPYSASSRPYSAGSRSFPQPERQERIPPGAAEKLYAPPPRANNVPLEPPEQTWQVRESSGLQTGHLDKAVEKDLEVGAEAAAAEQQAMSVPQEEKEFPAREVPVNHDESTPPRTRFIGHARESEPAGPSGELSLPASTGIAITGFPELHWIGQHHGTYIVAQADDGLYLIDQHAAHERINYEYYLYKFGHPAAESQGLLVPVTLEFTPGEAAQLRDRLELFREVGVEIESFGAQTFLVRAYPEWLPKGDEQSVLEEMADLLIAERKSIDIGKLREKAAIMCACKASIKANDRMSREEGDVLLARLAGCSQPYTCPHGRPIIVHLSTYQLEKMFKRVMS